MSTYDDRLTVLEQKVAALTLSQMTSQSDILSQMGTFNKSASSVLAEHKQTIEFVHRDMTASFKQQAAYQTQFEHHIDEQFDQVNERFDAIHYRLNKVDSRFDKIETRLDKVESDITEIKATMATKKEMAAMETRMLDAFKQLVATIEMRLPPPKE